MLLRIKIVLLAGLTILSSGCSGALPKQAAIPTMTEDNLRSGFQLRQERDDELNPRRLRNLPAATIVEQGRNALARGDRTLARFYFSVALGKDDDLIEAYLGLGETLIAGREHQAALTVLNQALEKAPECPQAANLLGVLYRNLGKNREALALFDRAMELDPENPSLLTELAVTCELDGQLTRAEEYFRRTTKLCPDSPAAWNNLGFNLMLQERSTEAIPALEQAFRLAPKKDLIINNLALAYALGNQELRALELFESSIGQAGAYNNLGYLLMLKNQDLAAQGAFNRALDASPRFYARARENLQRLQNRNDYGQNPFE
ncbi:MAG: tetratricopeptide repeat protein [Desulfuromonadaceae bacterium]